MHAHREILRLAIRDFTFEARISLCFVLALMSVLAPLLVLFGLKFGLVDTLAQRLIQSPAYREIIPVGSRDYEPQWFADIASRSDVGFLVANTRRIAASLSEVRRSDGGTGLTALQMIPSGPGDPLLGNAPAPRGLNEVVLSATAAQRLGVSPGDQLAARIDRRRNGREEAVTWTLDLVGVTAPQTLPDDAALVALPLLEATEEYRDGVAVPALGWEGETATSQPRRYARFRLYASTIEEVEGLAETLRQQGIEVRTRATEIATMQALDRNLTRVFWLVALLGSSGFLASLAANLLANVERKRRDLSVVRLLGFPTLSLVLFPVIQSLLVAVLGAVAALAAYWPVAVALNLWFAETLEPGEHICRLLPVHVAVAMVLTALGAVAAAAWAGVRVAHIEPAEGLRDV
jgi:putative ABC transport system permease protein